MTDVNVIGGVDFNAYLKDFAATFAATGRGQFSAGLGGDEYVLWSGSDATIPVEGSQAFIIDSGDDGDLAYDFTTHTVGGTIDSIEFGIGVTDDAGDFSTQASVKIDDLDLKSTGADGVVNQLITDLMAGQTDVLLDLLRDQDLDFTGSKADDAFKGFNGNDELDGGKGDDILKGGNGNDVLIGGKGDDVLFGQKGNDTFEFDGKKFGHDVIADFGKGKGDAMAFDDSVFSSFKDVMAAAEQKGDDVVISIGKNASVTLEDTTLASLNKGDFIFD